MTTLNLFNESPYEAELPTEALRTCFEAICRDHGHEAGWLNVILLDEKEHTTLNAKHLGHDYATDVITFSFNENLVANGEIYINPEMAERNAAEFQANLNEELNRLVIHGILHLIGHDDRTEAERDAMHKLENKYIKGFM